MSRLSIGQRWVLLGCALLAGVVRSLPWRNFLDRDGAYLFYGPDSYDHLRRITLGMKALPAIPSFDAYYGYPVGTGQIWSPGFDYLLSLAALLVGGSLDAPAAAHFIGFWLPPLLAMVTIVLVHRVTNMLYGPFAAGVAALLLALLPGHILYSFVSELDHHVAEPMVCLLLMGSLIKWGDGDIEPSRLLPGWARVGCWLVFAIFIWRGSVIFWGGALLALSMQLVAGRGGSEVSRYARLGVGACLTAAALLAPVCGLMGGAGGIKFGIISWFHVIMLVTFAVLWLPATGLVAVTRGRLLGAGGLVLAGVGLFLALPTGRRFIRELTAGLAVIGSSDPWLDSISELRPLLFPAGRLDLWHVSETLSLLWWLVPIILFMIFRLWRQSGCREFRHALFLAFGGLLWVIPLFRERYIHLAAVVIAIGGGWACVWLRTKLTQRGWGAFVRPALAGSLLILLLPTAPFLWQLPAVALPAAERYDLQDAMVWLRDKTPATADFATPLSPPAYGVLSEWHNGAYIDYLGRRPTVATNFGWETHGLFESAAFLTMTDPDAAERLLLENRVRYLVLDDISAMLPAQAAIAAYGEKSGRYGALVLPPFKPLASMYYRLYIQDGAAYQVADVSAAALGGYRLVFETVGTNFDPVVGPVSRYKIYQVVPGALVAGRARPGVTVTLELPLKSPTGRLFSWKSGVVADQTGRFSCRVPYATDRPSGDVVPQDSYLVHSGGATVRLVVPEAAVANGQTVQLTTP